MICVAPALRSRQSEASLCRMVSQSSLGNLSEIHCLERPRLWLWILVCWLVRGVSVSYFSVPLFLFLWHEVNRRAHIRGKSKWILLCDTLPAALFWGEKQWIRSFHSFYVIIIIIAVFNDNWPRAWDTSAYRVLRWKVRSEKLASWASTGPAWSSRFLPPHYLGFPFSPSLLP